MTQHTSPITYRGRLAPSPTGYLHLGHARTFWVAQERAQARSGVLVLRNEDLDATRFKLEFAGAMLEDLKWFGFDWHEGPDCGGPFGPYNQSERREFYLAAMRKLLAGGFIYPCTCSRSDVRRALSAPHQGEDEPVYPGTCRHKFKPGSAEAAFDPNPASGSARRRNWRFRVPDREGIAFTDGQCGPQRPSRERTSAISWSGGTMAFRLTSYPWWWTTQPCESPRWCAARTCSIPPPANCCCIARWRCPPEFYHCPLMTDEQGVRLAKRHDALSLRRLRAQGISPAQLRAQW